MRPTRYEARTCRSRCSATRSSCPGRCPAWKGEAVIAAIDAFAERLRSDRRPRPRRRAPRRRPGRAGQRRRTRPASLPDPRWAARGVDGHPGHTRLGDPVWTTSRGHTLTPSEQRFTACDPTVTPIAIDTGTCPDTIADLGTCAADPAAGLARGSGDATAPVGSPTPGRGRIAALAAHPVRRTPDPAGRRTHRPDRHPRPAQGTGRPRRRMHHPRLRGSPPRTARPTTSQDWAAGGDHRTSTTWPCSAGHTTARSTSTCGPSTPRPRGTTSPNPTPAHHPEPPGPPTTAHPGPSPAHTAPAGDCEEPAAATYPVTAMNAAAGEPPTGGTAAPMRWVSRSLPAPLASRSSCLRWLQRWTATGPALGLLPGTGSAAYRSMISTAVVPGAPVPAEVAVVAATSGSTGNPAGVLLPASALRAAARGFAERAGQPEGHRWVAALPLHHAGGLMVAVRSVVAGTIPGRAGEPGGGRSRSQWRPSRRRQPRPSS